MNERIELTDDSSATSRLYGLEIDTIHLTFAQ